MKTSGVPSDATVAKLLMPAALKHGDLRGTKTQRGF